MGKPQKTAAQKALVQLRYNLGLTQQDLAVRMNKAVVTVAKWETSRPPDPQALLELINFAIRNGQRDISDAFWIELGLLGFGAVLKPEVDAGKATVFDFIATTNAFTHLLQNCHLPSIESATAEVIKVLQKSHAELLVPARSGKTVRCDPIEVEATQASLVRIVNFALPKTTSTEHDNKKARKTSKQ